jgi:protein-S-isoprenylcysteine O-methyltransferase Ste14
MNDSSFVPFVLLTGAVAASAATYLQRNRSYKVHVGGNPGIGRPSAALGLSYVLGSVIVLACIPIGLFVDTPVWFDLHDNILVEWGGALVCVLGVACFLAAVRALGVNYAPNYDSRMPHKLVATGPYRFVRHPIYVANVIAILGLAISTGVTITFVVALFLAVTYYRSACLEDVALEALRNV